MAATVKDTVLDRHNSARAKHGVSNLKWSDELAKIAQGHTNSCEFKHKVEGAYGQNLGWVGWSGGSAPNAITTFGDMVTTGWYGEISKFTQWGVATPNMDNFGDWGHFTQVVWKSTYEVGCAYTTCDGGKAYFFECNYRTPGNYIGEFGKNVPRKI
ncbi:CAP domain-containing protein [Microdochium trichocladiopsis]|uniref:CAP domain-containing protein n=1 Tax=Microdochium trichocladiopsis TaxID=1682393 RepID=A0A9P8XZ07_9PEZI|nr:CAP domain-containing protein [Microdochium trichocladiopsis]KAH7024675.1 CAP domain-containing protein [Microdochium trichocladiopsis]